MKTLISFLVLCVLCTSAQAGRLVGNGGDGVVTKSGQVFSLDLVEAGVAENPFVANVAIEEKFRVPIGEKFMSVETFPLELFLRKLSEINGRSPSLAHVLAAALLQLRWNSVERELLPIDDEDSSFRYREGELVQLAARRDFTVFIDQQYFQRLPDAHKVALILHELVYLMMPVEQQEEGALGEPFSGRQSSLKARAIVGELFKPAWREADLADWLFGQLLEDSLIRDIELPVSRPKFEYRFRKGGFTRLMVPANGKIFYQAVSNGPLAVRGSVWTQAELEDACVARDRDGAVKMKNVVLVSPIGEEFLFLRQEYCQSRDMHGKCVVQTGLIAAPVHSKGSHDRGYLFRTRDFSPAGAYTANRNVDQKAIRECAAGLAKKILQVAKDPYGERSR